MTVPNLITTIRIILTPIFVIYLLGGQFLSGLIVFMICVLSDGLDGTLARLFNQKSKLGSYLDPLADKMLLISAFVVLAILGFLPSWLTVLAISRDVLIMLGIFILYLNGLKITIKPSILSKITTCLQFTAIIVVLSRDFFSSYQSYFPYLFYLAGLFTIISGLQYMHYWFKIIGEGASTEG
ncbi:MAG: CDP-alcohol phosphatidyltransferase family protein [Deltaproteobacteria bacterium]|nr:CDP-alcohol phosphatidyltransferase family protein [Deltaproteobacteria bacterium]